MSLAHAHRCRPLLERLEERALLTTVFWNVDADGFWDVAANWRDDQGMSRLPGTNDDVVIDRPAANVSVAHRSGTTRVRSLTSREDFVLFGGALVLAEASAFHALFTLDNGALLAGAGDVTAHGVFNWIRGEMSGPGATIIPSNGRLNATGSFTKSLREGRTLRNGGTALMGPGSDSVSLSEGSSIHNLAGATWQVRGSAVIRSFPSEGSFHNAGRVEVQSGRLDFLLGGTQQGTFHAAAGTELQLGQGAWNIADGAAFTGPGLKRFIPGLFTLAGTVIGENCEFVIATVAGTFTLDGTFRWSSGDLSGPGTMTVAAGSTFTLAGGLHANAVRTLNNAGTIVFAGQFAELNLSAAGSLFRNLPGATVRSATSFPGHIYGPNTFQNDGTLRVESGILDLHGSLRNLSAATLTGGTYVVQGRMQLSPNLDIRTNAAALTLDGPDARVITETFGNALANFATNTAAGSFTLQGGHTFLRNGAFSNAGTVTLDAGSLFEATGTYTQTGGRTVLTWGGISASLVDLQGGVLEGSGYVLGDLRNAGRLNVGGAGAAGYFFVLGNFTQTTAGVLALEIGGLALGQEYDLLYVSGAAVLGGTLSLGLLNGFVPSPGDLFVSLLFASVSGDFSTIDGLFFGKGRAFYPFRDDTGYYLWTYQI